MELRLEDHFLDALWVGLRISLRNPQCRRRGILSLREVPGEHSRFSGGLSKASPFPQV